MSALAELTRGTRVTVNAILPGPTNTEAVRAYHQEIASSQGVTREQDRRQNIVVLGGASHPAGHAEGGEGGAGRRGGGEEVGVGRVRAGPAAFDVVDPEGVEGLRDLGFFGARELDPLRLLAVAERGVEEEEAVEGHGRVHGGQIFEARDFNGLRARVRVVLRFAETPPRT